MGRSLTVKQDLIDQHRKDTDQLLRSLMPDAVAERFKQGEETIAMEHHKVTVIFADIIGLERLQVELSPEESLTLVNELIRQMDAAAEHLGMERVHTVRNGYLASCGLAYRGWTMCAGRSTSHWSASRSSSGSTPTPAMSSACAPASTPAGVSSGLFGTPSVVYDMWGAAVNIAHQIKNGSPQPGYLRHLRVQEVLQETVEFTPAGTIAVDGATEPVWRLSETP